MAKTSKQIYRKIKKGENINLIKMPNKKASAVLWIMVVLVILIIGGLVSYLIFFSGSESKETGTNSEDSSGIFIELFSILPIKSIKFLALKGVHPNNI